MARLIDVEEVINIAKNTYTEEDVLKIAWLLCHTPTAYDVEKVVKEIEEDKFKHPFDEDEETINSYIDRAIKAVRKGGVE